MAHLAIPQAGVEAMAGEVYLSSADATKYQNVPFGFVQEFDFSDTISKKDLMGPRSKMPVAMLQTETKITGSCKFASSNAQILATIRGATISKVTTGTGATAKTITTVTRSGTDNIIPCGVQLIDVENENGPNVFFYYVVFTDFKSPKKLRDYTIFDATFECYTEPVSGKVYDIFYPGDQTVAFALPTGITLDSGLTADQTDYATVHGAAAAPNY